MKRALVTGGTRGIGFAVCELLLEKGYEVTATYSAEGGCSDRAKKLLPAVKFMRADVRDRAALEGVFSTLPTLDLLVNNAGVSHFALVQDVSDEEYDEVMDINLKGAFACTRLAVKRMLSEQRGCIVNISSVWGQTGASCESVYSASKGGMIALTQSLAKELAPSRIRVNCVAPGVIDTAMNDRFTQEELADICAEIPLGRMGRAEEVAHAVLFLAENEYLTGVTLPVNGGFYM